MTINGKELTISPAYLLWDLSAISQVRDAEIVLEPELRALIIKDLWVTVLEEGRGLTERSLDGHVSNFPVTAIGLY